LAVLACVLLALGFGSHALAGPAGTLDRLVADLDARLGNALTGRALKNADMVLAVSQGAGAPLKLVQVLEGQVLGKLNARGFRSVTRAKAGLDAEGRRRIARKSGAELLLDLEAVVDQGYLHLRGGLEPTDHLIWRDIISPQQGTLSHLHARVRVDAEVRAYLGRVRSGPLRLSPRIYDFAGRQVLALAAADVDGDGRVELLALQPRTVTVLKLKQGARGWAKALMASLRSPLAGMSPRRVMGALVAQDLDGDGRAEVLARSSELEKGARLTFDGNQLIPQGDFWGYPLFTEGDGAGVAKGVTCRAVAGKDLLDGATLSSGAGASGRPPLPTAFYGMVRVQVPRQQGGPLSYYGVAEQSGRLRIFEGALTRQVAELPTAGVAFDLADLDDDGSLELITSDANGPDKEDRVTIYRLSGHHGPQITWRGARLGGRVTALTHGDLDGDGKLEVVAALLTPQAKTRLVVLD